jgi:hypothetical protein
MEFLNGFTDYGFKVSEAKTLEDCRGKTILLLSNHRVDYRYLNSIKETNPDAVYILWYYHDHLSSIPFKKFILTGEYFFHTPRTASHIRFDSINKSILNFVPLMLRANESPRTIGTVELVRPRDGVFMGTPYKAEWAYGLQNTLYHDTNQHGLLPYETRKVNYLTSKVAFGFHDPANILNYHVTQRVYEGLAYGCVVLSDNPAAAEMTGGIVEYVANMPEFLEKLAYFLNNEDACKQKREAGYNWVKKYGTNRYSTILFLKKINELFGMNYIHAGQDNE